MQSHHPCHAIGCDRPISPRLLFCKPHWDLLLPSFQKRIKKHYRRGQEKDKKPSLQYLKAHYAAVNWVAHREDKELIDVRKRLEWLKKNKLV